MKTCQVALTLAAVVIVNHSASMIKTADAFATAAFVPPTSLQGDVFLKATVGADNDDATDEGPAAFEKTSFLDRLVHRKQQAKEALQTKAQSLKEKAQTMKLRAKENLRSLETKLEQVIQEETDELINLIALDTVRLFHGHWDFYVINDMEDANTKKEMESNIEELASDFVALGLEEEDNKSLLKEEIKDSRLRITQSFDGTDYPLKLQHEVFLGSEPVMQLYGQLQFDLLEHKGVYALDELVVLGTNVKLKEIIQAQAAQAAAMEEEEVDDMVMKRHEDQDVLMEEIASALKEDQETDAAKAMESDRLVWAIEQLEG